MFKASFPKIDKIKTKTFGMMFKLFVYSFAIFGFLFMLLLLAIMNFLKQDSIMFTPVPKEAVLTVNFDDIYTETKVDDLISELAEIRGTTFFDLIKAINIAAIDDRIKSIVADISSTNLGLAQIEELRRTIELFRSTGKKAYIYSSGFGAFGNGTGEYYLASAFDEIWLIPGSEVGITGISFEIPFLRGILDKVGVEPEFYTRYEYKNAVAFILNKNFEAAHKREIQRMGGVMFDNIIKNTAVSRNIHENDLKKIVNNAPIDSKLALERKLVDKTGYRQNVLDKATNEGKLKTISVGEYLTNLEEKRGKKFPMVAFLAVEGVIDHGESSNSAFEDAVIGSQTVIEQLEEIAKEKNLKALVVRVNSPGGSYTASKEIWYSLIKLKTDKKIPVIISMGDYAASGGYFISLAGDYILAEESTFTGSIGVLGGKFVLSGLWDKLGINWGSVNFGDNAGILSINHKFSKKEAENFNRSLDNTYKDFVSTVSGTRGIDLDAMDTLARGRVWMGKDAVTNGLVDEIGGINRAIVVAKEKSGIKAGEKFSLVYYPRSKTIQEKIADFLGKRKRKASVAAILDEIGVSNMEFITLQRLQYDTILAPMVIRF